MKYIDKFLNSLTMYRLLIHGLGTLLCISIVVAWYGLLPFTPGELIISTVVLFFVCNVVNYSIAKILKAPLNVESATITALILTLIIAPPISSSEFIMVIAAGVIAMASKYILAINKKHIFNPAAIAAVCIGLLGSGLVSWWISSSPLLIFVLIFGLLVIRKIRRFALFGTFFIVSFLLIVIPRIVAGQDTTEVVLEVIKSWPLVFLGTIMLTEPATTPPSQRLQIMYAALVGCFLSLRFQFGPLYSSPEVALVIGNIFSYLVSPKKRLHLILQSSQALSKDIYEFIFTTSEKLKFKAGQYLEWTLPQLFLESRGNRRYFTIASAPTENNLRLGIRIFPNGSRFKEELVKMKPGEALWASQLTGDFVLPDNKQEKLLFIAGGVGITPFRSMIKYLSDHHEQRDIVLIYACLLADNFVYQDVFSEAEKVIGLKTVYLITDLNNIPDGWQGKSGFIDEKLLKEVAPDYKQRMYYLSGPNSMVEAYLQLLKNLGVKRKAIKKDYFPGY